MSLTAKQRAFVDAYLVGFNATQAAKDAGYSERSAHSIGCENLNKPEIAEEIAARMAERTVSADEVLVRLAEVARGSLEDFYSVGEDGQPVLDLGKAQTRGRLHLVKSLSPTRYGWRLELYDRTQALQLIGKHLGLFDDTRLNVDVDFSALDDEQLERLAKGEPVQKVLYNRGQR